jgi:hypothetical protein
MPVLRSAIARGNTDLSQRLEEQAAALQEATSGMQELTSTGKLNAANARRPVASRMGCRRWRRGMGPVDDVVETMRDWRPVRSVTGIIAVIDGIAFQTNIFALHAALDAAVHGVPSLRLRLLDLSRLPGLVPLRTLARNSPMAQLRAPSTKAPTEENPRHGRFLLPTLARPA